nr:TIGR02444 family protein [uncultured Halomonas sp.]
MDDHSTQFSLSLWDYALILYARPGVAAACLALQDDHGADVCELFWLCWLNRLDLTTDANAAATLAPIRQQQAALTRLLRERRRELKPHAQPDSSLAQWRKTIKNAELAAEQGTLMQLQALAEHGRGVRSLRHNDAPLITRLVGHLGCHDSTISGHLRVLVAQSHTDSIEHSGAGPLEPRP